MNHRFESVEGSEYMICRACGWAVAQAPQPTGECLGDELDTASSASRQHYIDTGRYLTHAEAMEVSGGGAS